jgi:hypothetical protein
MERSERILVMPQTGEQIYNLINSQANMLVGGMIVIIFPAEGNPQPGFITNLDPEVMEDVIIQLGESLTPELRASRVLVKDKEGMN